MIEVSDFDKLKEGTEASQLNKNEAFIRATEAVKNRLIEDLTQSKWMRKGFREKTYDRLQALDWIKRELANSIHTKNLTQKRLEAKKDGRKQRSN